MKIATTLIFILMCIFSSANADETVSAGVNNNGGPGGPGNNGPGDPGWPQSLYATVHIKGITLFSLKGRAKNLKVAGANDHNYGNVLVDPNNKVAAASRCCNKAQTRCMSLSSKDKVTHVKGELKLNVVGNQLVGLTHDNKTVEIKFCNFNAKKNIMSDCGFKNNDSGGANYHASNDFSELKCVDAYSNEHGGFGNGPN